MSYRTPEEKQAIGRWIRSLRNADGKAAREQEFRQELLGSLETGGKLGVLPGPALPNPVDLDGFYHPQPDEVLPDELP